MEKSEDQNSNESVQTVGINRIFFRDAQNIWCTSCSIFLCTAHFGWCTIRTETQVSKVLFYLQNRIGPFCPGPGLKHTCSRLMYWNEGKHGKSQKCNSWNGWRRLGKLQARRTSEMTRSFSLLLLSWMLHGWIAARALCGAALEVLESYSWSRI